MTCRIPSFSSWWQWLGSQKPKRIWKNCYGMPGIVEMLDYKYKCKKNARRAKILAFKMAGTKQWYQDIHQNEDKPMEKKEIKEKIWKKYIVIHCATFSLALESTQWKLVAFTYFTRGNHCACRSKSSAVLRMKVKGKTKITKVTGYSDTFHQVQVAMIYNVATSPCFHICPMALGAGRATVQEL